MTFLTVVAVLAAGCSTGPNGQTADTRVDTPQVDSDRSELDALGDVNVDRGLLTVTITVPAELAEDGDVSGLIDDFSDRGINVSDVARHPDGSITYRIPRGDYRRLMQELAADFTTSLDEAAADFDSVDSLTANADFTRFRLVVDRDQFENSFDGFIVFVPLFTAGLYAIFDGRDPEQLEVTVELVDRVSGAVYDTLLLPDDLDS